MRAESYLERCRDLGISRGQLEQGFRPDLPGVVAEPEANWKVTKAVTPPPITEDLSRFQARKAVSTQLRIASMLARAGKRMRPLYESLAARKVTVAMIAEAAGVERNLLTEAMRGRPASAAVKAKAWPLFTKEEQRILNWNVGEMQKSQCRKRR